MDKTRTRGLPEGAQRSQGGEASPRSKPQIKAHANQVRCVGVKTNLFSCIFFKIKVSIFLRGKNIPFFSKSFSLRLQVTKPQKES